MSLALLEPCQSSRDTLSKLHAIFCGVSHSVGNGALASEASTKSGSLYILRPKPRLLFLYLASELMLLYCGAGEDLRVPWTARRSEQSTRKEINPEYSLQELMLKLNLQYFGHLMGRADSLEKTLMLGKIEAGGEGTENEIVGWHHRLNGHEFEQALGVGDGQGTLWSMGSQRVVHD